MPDVLVIVSDSPLDESRFEAFVSDAANGAVVTFRGVIRDHDAGRSVHRLEYSAHPDAESFLAACCQEVADATGLKVAAGHRIGTLDIGDTALVACVAAAHRAEAFGACAELVELIKHRVPIWKRQHLADGATEWVGLTH